MARLNLNEVCRLDGLADGLVKLEASNQTLLRKRSAGSWNSLLVAGGAHMPSFSEQTSRVLFLVSMMSHKSFHFVFSAIRLASLSRATLCMNGQCWHEQASKARQGLPYKMRPLEQLDLMTIRLREVN